MSTISLPTTESGTIPVAQARARLQDCWWKVVLDRGVAMLLMLVAAPLILLLLVAVRLTSRGVPLYTQQRLGVGGREFTIYKIRTMYQDSEAQGRAMWSQPGDPRVTPLGRILRATHLDELPQLWNILRGEMSLIGPRPERPEIAASLEQVLPRYAERLRVRPGLSGLAQVLQGPDADLLSVKTKLEYDLFYLENFGFGLDLRIAIATLLHLARCPEPTIARMFGFPTAASEQPRSETLTDLRVVTPLQLPELAQ